MFWNSWEATNTCLYSYLSSHPWDKENTLPCKAQEANSFVENELPFSLTMSFTLKYCNLLKLHHERKCGMVRINPRKYMMVSKALISFALYLIFHRQNIAGEDLY